MAQNACSYTHQSKEAWQTKLSVALAGFFFTKKVTPIIGVFPSANFPQEKYFSPSKVFFPKQSIFPQEINFPYVDTKYCYAAKLAKIHVTNVLVVYFESSIFEVGGKLSLIGPFCFLNSFLCGIFRTRLRYDTNNTGSQHSVVSAFTLKKT